MADPFENQVSQLFGETPVFADAAVFTARFDRRLERELRLRQLWLGGAGVVGAVIALVQGFAAGLGDRLLAVSSRTGEVMDKLVSTGGTGGLVSPDSASLILVVAGLAVLMLGLRAAREI